MISANESHRLPDSWDPISVCPAERLPLLRRFAEMLGEVNRSVNLVSRDSVQDLWMRHVVHSLCLGRRRFPEGVRVVDWGTGGGLPMLPLAVVFPGVRFTGVDAVRKKVMAVRAMIRRLEIDNAEAVHSRAESWDGEADYSVSRATAPLSTLWSWHSRVASPGAAVAGFWPPGLICLKGGDLSDEVKALQTQQPDVHVEIVPLARFVAIPQFVAKHIVVATTHPA